MAELKKKDDNVSLLTFYVQDAKVDVDPYVCNILLAGTQIVFTGVSMILVDRLLTLT